MIPEEIKEDIDKIINEIINYKNVSNLSWTGAYKDILKKLNMEDKITDNKLLINVIKKITMLGYDIISDPFKLEKFK